MKHQNDKIIQVDKDTYIDIVRKLQEMLHEKIVMWEVINLFKGQIHVPSWQTREIQKRDPLEDILNDIMHLSNEVAIIIKDELTVYHRDIINYRRENWIKRIIELIAHIFQYLLLFLKGEDGYHLHIRKGSAEAFEKEDCLCNDCLCC